MLKIPRSINLMLPLLLCSAGMHAAVFSAPDNKMSTMHNEKLFADSFLYFPV